MVILFAILSLFSLVVSLICLGYLLANTTNYRRSAGTLDLQTEKFKESMEIAQKANETLAPQLLRHEARIESLEFWKNNPGASTTPSSNPWSKLK